MQSGRIRICMGTSGLSAGAEQVAATFRKELKQHKLADSYRIERTGDRGLFRDVLVDIIQDNGATSVYQDVRPDNVAEIVKSHLVEGKPVSKLLAGNDYDAFFKGQLRIVLANCGEIDPENIDDYLSSGGYQSLRKALSLDPAAIVETIRDSGLRGRGGGGFSTGTKWDFCSKAEGDKKYVVCNADEGDPGAFMDRSILESDPHAVIEGMAIAGYAIGANEGVVYCRAEYPLAVKRLRTAISQSEKNGFLGNGILDSSFSFNLRIMQGAGAFVCGEETALLASIEGKRGTPRPRPPFPAQSGLWGKPTLINNVETFANVRHIIKNGAEWFNSIGTKTSKGTKVFALAGKVKNTGLIEVPMGTTLKELIFGPGGGMLKKRIGLKGVQIGGPSGGCLPEELLDTPIDYESITGTGAIMGSGGIIVMDKKTCMVDVARYFLSFTVSESCGQCPPCRIGLKRMLEILEEITSGHGKSEYIRFLEEMGSTIKSTSLCGLGSTAPNPALTTIKYYKDEYDAHVSHRECHAHVCTELIKFEVIQDLCTKCGRCYSACNFGAVDWSKGNYARIDQDKCTECKACINACDFMAIE